MLNRTLTFFYPICFVLTVVLWSTYLQASSDQEDVFRELAHEISEISHQYYQEAAQELRNTHYIKRSLRDLKNTVTRLVKAEEHALANAVILANASLIKKNVDHKYMPFFLAQLLEHNIWRGSQDIVTRAFSQGSTATKSELHYLLAKYHFSHDELYKAIGHLTNIQSERALARSERDYATLMFGIALQKQKKHREALKIYQKIEKDSIYFGHSRLNMAVAHIRQNWWTDAQIAIDEALTETPPQHLHEINNRLLLVLGYSQLQNEFYRNARDTFRRISLNSEYMNRALHGIGLCAISQKDYLGAINAFTRLRNSENHELVVLESHLLIPYTYNRVGDLDNAAQGYADAITYYENIIRELDARLLSLNIRKDTAIEESDIDNLPEYMQENYHMLYNLNTQKSSTGTQKRIQAAKERLHEITTTTLIADLNEKISYTRSYLSQSQYGLAKLYDTPE